MFVEYLEEYTAARTTEAAGNGAGTSNIHLYPKDLCDLLDKKLNTYFAIKSYVLDPKQAEIEPLQSTS